MNRYFLTIAMSLLAVTPTAALANGSCSSAKKLVEGAKAFYGDKTELRDVVQPQLDVFLNGINGHPNPTQMLYRWEDVEHSLPIVAGRVEGLEAAASWSEKGELCSLYDDGPLPATKDETVNLTVFLRFPFLRKEGAFPIKEINEGAKDGSKIIKSLAPTGLGFAAPGLKTFVVMPETLDQRMPILTFMRNGEPVNPRVTKYNRTQYIRLKDLKAAKVDVVAIETPFRAYASFKIDPKKVAESEAKRLASLKDDETE